MVKVIFTSDVYAKNAVVLGITDGKLFLVGELNSKEDRCLYVIADYSIYACVSVKGLFEVFVFAASKNRMTREDENKIFAEARRLLTPDKGETGKLYYSEVQHGQMYMMSPYNPSEAWPVHLYSGPEKGVITPRSDSKTKPSTVSEVDTETVTVISKDVKEKEDTKAVATTVPAKE